ncbi:MAG: hypothetical protein HY698_16335 [Deltaproteobacteria bacterium]|nr:hypothetical protein [Deltaproteobacteria bacterium]
MLRALRHHHIFRAATVVAVAVVLNLVPSHANAHNGEVHRDMVDLSYQVMRWVAAEKATGSGGGLHGLPRLTEPPPDVDPTQWNQFITAVASSAQRLSVIDSPAATASLGSDWAKGYFPGGIFNLLATSGFGSTSALSGRALGIWAAGIDDEVDDTHLWVRPTSVGYLGALKALYQKAWSKGVGLIVAAIYCAYQWIFGGDDCEGDAKELTNELDLVSKVEGLIPGIGDVSGDPFTTIWHFINMQDDWRVENGFDDRQGLYYLHAGWYGPTSDPIVPEVDPVDFGILVFLTGTGLSINHGKSNGPKRYEIESDSDFHKKTIHRTKGQWQFLPLGLTVVEPLDNLAKWGWDQYRATTTPGRFRMLGWPLHAIGDATAPHHVIGVTGWGHRPYEDAEAQAFQRIRRLWGAADAIPTANEKFAQFDLARDILVKAFNYRKGVLDWRAARARPTDTPVRDLVTQLASETLNYSSGIMERERWPYKLDASTEYHLGFKGSSIASYLDDGFGVGRMGVLLQNGMAATVAFLTSATEVTP